MVPLRFCLNSQRCVGSDASKLQSDYFASHSKNSMRSVSALFFYWQFLIYFDLNLFSEGLQLFNYIESSIAGLGLLVQPFFI